MGIRKIMEGNRDTAGWGFIGTAMAFFMSSGIWNQIVTATLIAGSGCLASYIVKKIVIYLEDLVKNWWDKRKTKVTTSNKKELNEGKNIVSRIVGSVRKRFSRGSGSEV